jgi:hypothetical protein
MVGATITEYQQGRRVGYYTMCNCAHNQPDTIRGQKADDDTRKLAASPYVHNNTVTTKLYIFRKE